MTTGFSPSFERAMLEREAAWQRRMKESAELMRRKVREENERKSLAAWSARTQARPRCAE